MTSSWRRWLPWNRGWPSWKQSSRWWLRTLLITTFLLCITPVTIHIQPAKDLMPTTHSQKNDPTYQRYMRDVEAYLQKVRNGRRVAGADHQAPRFSQEADDARLWQRGQIPAGVGSSGIPQMSTQRPQPEASQAPPAASPSRVWGFHEPTVTAGEGVDAAMQGMGRAMQDPRFGMASGIGGIAGVTRAGRYFGQGRPRAPHDVGGFTPTVQEMKAASPYIDKPQGAQTLKDTYVGQVQGLNDLAEMQRGSGLERVQGREALERLRVNSPSLANDTDRAFMGMARLRGDVRSAGALESDVPPEVINKYFQDRGYSLGFRENADRPTNFLNHRDSGNPNTSKFGKRE